MLIDSEDAVETSGRDATGPPDMPSEYDKVGSSFRFNGELFSGLAFVFALANDIGGSPNDFKFPGQRRTFCPQ